MQGPGALGVVSTVLIAGTGFSGVFLYSPAAGTGTLTESGAAVAGTDLYTNPYVAGWATYGNNGQIVAIQVLSGAARIVFFSGAASETSAVNISTVVFNRGLANEQFAVFMGGGQSSASPFDNCQVEMYSSPANAPGNALGFVQYVQFGGTPAALVQTTPSGTSTGGSITLTFPANTTPGNCIVVYVQGDSTTGNDPHVSGITISASADHFAQGVQALGATDVEIWTDQNLTPAGTSVVVSFAGGTGAQRCSAIAEEWSGIAATAAVDQTSGTPNGGPATSYTSGTTSGLTLVGEVACGIAGSENTTFAGPASPWANNAQINSGAAAMICGHQVLPSISGIAYANTMSPSVKYSAAVLTLKPAAAGTGVRLLPAGWGKFGWKAGLVAQCAAAVPGSSPAVQETWHTLSLVGNWQAFAGFHTPRYQFEAVNGGRVRLSGVVQATAANGAGTTIATLPVGYRPTASIIMPTTATQGGFTITSAGVITNNQAVGINNGVGFDGCTFEID